MCVALLLRYSYQLATGLLVESVHMLKYIGIAVFVERRALLDTTCICCIVVCLHALLTVLSVLLLDPQRLALSACCFFLWYSQPQHAILH
jgi:hypothetical protein